MNNEEKFCGIDCVFQNQSDVWKFLRFPTINLESYHFTVNDVVATWGGNSYYKYEFPYIVNPNFFENKQMEFLCVEEMVLHLYHQYSSISSKSIDTYTDYVNSRCEMIVLLCDCCYVEVYCKNKEWLKRLFDNAKKNPDTKVEKKYEGIDPRTEMHVW